MLQSDNIHTGPVQDRADGNSRDQVAQDRTQTETRGKRNGDHPGQEQRECDEHELSGHGVFPVLSSNAVPFANLARLMPDED